VAEVPAGASVGYGGAWTAARPSRIATLAVGYADGWTRLYAPGSTARVRAAVAPLVGRVGSDAVALDVTDVPGFSTADEVTLVAPDVVGASTVEDLARRRGSIAWEVLDAFTPRLARVYMEAGEPVAVRYLDGALIRRSGFSLRLEAG
jgi:alanine racemase